MKKTIFPIFIIGILLVVFLSLFTNNVQAAHRVKVKIEYEYSWTGNIQGDTGKSVDGEGTESFDVIGDIIVASAQKGDDSGEPLTISIIAGGVVVQTETTTAAYGSAIVSYSFPLEELEEESTDSESGLCSMVLMSSFVFVGAGGMVIFKRRK